MTQSPWASTSAALVQALLGPVLFVLAVGAAGVWAFDLDRSSESIMQEPNNRATATVTRIAPPQALEVPSSEEEAADNATAAQSVSDDQSTNTEVDEIAVTFTYFNPTVSSKVDVELVLGGLNGAGLTAEHIDDAGLPPLSVDQTIDIGFLPDNPYRIARWGRPVRRSLTVPTLALTTIGVLAVLGYSLRTQRRLRSLAAGHTNLNPEHQRFRMLGALRRTRWSSSLILDLFPLDSDVGDTATCSVPLADITIRGEADRGFPVDLAGLPRTGGVVVPKVGERMLWPRGRTLLTTAGQRPAIESDAVHHANGFDTFTPNDGSKTMIYRESTVLGIRGAIAWFFWLLTAWTLLAVWLNGSEETDAYADATQTVAVIANRVTDAFGVQVDLDPPQRPVPVDGWVAPVVTSNEFRVGQRYPAVLSSDRTRVRLRQEPYDPVSPIVAIVGLTAFPTVAVLRRAHNLRLARRDHGPR